VSDIATEICNFGGTQNAVLHTAAIAAGLTLRYAHAEHRCERNFSGGAPAIPDIVRGWRSGIRF
jgi:hypothetical protein